MHKNAMKCNKTQSKWCKNKHGASKIIDTFETYQYVAERYKESLWNDLMAHFNLPECKDEVAARKLRATVKQWTLKNMAELFRVWKKKL
jgi:hypothetical protein